MGLANLLMIPGLGGNAPSLLDSFGGAAAAYSVRRVRAGYNGSCLRVRRSSDSLEANVGFSNGVLDTAFLLAFVGAGDGFVTTLYDQSGNGNNLTQATALAQPRIVISGSLVTKNGKPAIDFTSSQFMGSTITGLSDATALSNFALLSPVNASAPDTSYMHAMTYASGGADTSNRGATVGGQATGVISGETICIFFSNASVSAGRLGSNSFSSTAGEQFILSSFLLSSGSSVFKNSSAVTLNLAFVMTTATDTSPANDGTALSTFRLNSITGATGAADQLFQESLVYLTSQTANRVAITSDINAFYSVY